MRGVLERTAARLSANGLTHDRKLDPLRRLRDGLDAILVPAIDSFARYLDLNEAFDSNAGRPRQESHVRWMINVRSMKIGSGTPVCCPERFWCWPAPSSPGSRRRGVAVANGPQRAMVEAIEKRQRTRAESPGPGALPLAPQP
jgi:hypothetical protein